MMIASGAEWLDDVQIARILGLQTAASQTMSINITPPEQIFSPQTESVTF